MKKLVAAWIVSALAVPVVAGPIAEGAFSAQTTIDDFSWVQNVDRSPNTLTHDGVSFTTPNSGWRALDGFGRPGSGVGLFDNSSMTRMSIDLGGTYERVGIDVIVRPGTYNVSFFNSATLLGTVTVDLVDDGPNWGFAGFDALGGITGLTITETSSDNSYVGGIDNLRLDAPVGAVPEPAMLGLFGLGAIGLALSRRRRA